MRTVSSLILLLLVPGLASISLAQEHRHHGTHEHGIGKLNLAQEDTEVHIELDTPAANIVGFEHTPSTTADRELLKKAIRVLEDGGRLFRFSKGAGCRLAEAGVTTPLSVEAASAQQHEDNHSHDAAHTAHDGEPEHADHSPHHERHHAHEEGTDEHGDAHADITAEYRFTCAYPAKLKQVDVQFFQAFPKTKRLLVQFITERGQGAAELTAPSSVLKF